MKNELLIINNVVKEISKIVPNCCGVTLGGSRAYNFEDELSDVEMYFYSTVGVPSLDDINKAMKILQAEHKRCDEFLWDCEPWGPHSFFLLGGLYFEVGYRIVDNVKNKIIGYMNGAVAPLPDAHDLGMGYMVSGLVASIASEKELFLCGDEIKMLKNKAAQFPPKLTKSLKREYLNTASSLLLGKLHYAAERDDFLCYNVISARIIRSLMVIAFACAKQHFPGDKWNEKLLIRSKWEFSSEFLKLLKEHESFSFEGELMTRRALLVKALRLCEKTMGV